MTAPGIVVIGAGHLGTYHIRKVRELEGNEEASLIGVIDVDEDVRSRVQSEHGVPTAASLDEWFSLHGDGHPVDAAIVAAPTAAHAAIGHAVLQRGWHLLMEKPIAASSEEGQALVDSALAAGRVLQVGHTERFNPAVAAALAIADRPRYVVAERLGPFTGRSTDVDVILDLMIHDLDIVASMIPSELVEVRALGVPVLTPQVDMASARLAFADGSVAQLSAGRASMEPSRKIRLFTLERYLSIDCQQREVKAVRRLPPAEDSPWPQITGELVEVGDTDPLFEQDRDFVRCIRESSAPRVDGAAGVRALRLAEEVKRALVVPLPEGVELPPELVG